MPNILKLQLRYVLELVIAATPWLVSMYLLYWFDSGETWDHETAHRGKLSVIILASGMGLSFLIQSYIVKHRQK